MNFTLCTLVQNQFWDTVPLDPSLFLVIVVKHTYTSLESVFTSQVIKTQRRVLLQKLRPALLPPPPWLAETATATSTPFQIDETAIATFRYPALP